ncbi:MAG: hypothetical protein AAGF73_10445 [Actinomycetota bacterium]
MMYVAAFALGAALAVTVGVGAVVLATAPPARMTSVEIVDAYADLAAPEQPVEAGPTALEPTDSAMSNAMRVEPVDAGTANGPSMASGCDQTVGIAELDTAFDQGVDGIVGADYQRAFELPDGRVLWVFQDAFIGDGDGAPTLVHNVGVVQHGACFDALHSGTDDQPGSWIGSDDTAAYQHWYWPLDGYVADDNTFVLFLAEMEEAGTSYLNNATPVATWSVEVDLDTLSVGPLERSPNPDERLFGFEVTTDDEYVYLYAQCHRQFGFGLLGHDECAADVFVARQPLDQPRSHPLEYWSSAGWTRNSKAAVNVAPSDGPDGAHRTVNPMQIQRDGDRWIAVTLVGDWWGDDVYFDVAARPEGPWTTTTVESLDATGGPDVASYFVSFVPSDEPGHTLAYSNNRWDGEYSEHYRPRFVVVSDGHWDT